MKNIHTKLKNLNYQKFNQIKMTTKSEETTKTSSKKYFYANGKRKTAVARVKIFKGSGSEFAANQIFMLISKNLNNAIDYYDKRKE